MTGADFSERMLELARQGRAPGRGAAREVDVRFEAANALALPYA